jgi:hypothetical protein
MNIDVNYVLNIICKSEITKCLSVYNVEVRCDRYTINEKKIKNIPITRRQTQLYTFSVLYAATCFDLDWGLYFMYVARCNV